jgi:hypothetical protein
MTVVPKVPAPADTKGCLRVSKMQRRDILAALEHFRECCSDAAEPCGKGLFGFWLRFGSLTGGFSNLRVRQSLAKSRTSAWHQKSSFRIATSFLSML